MDSQPLPDSQNSPPPQVDDICDNVITDPPPPYPDPARRHPTRPAHPHSQRRSDPQIRIPSSRSFTEYEVSDGMHIQRTLSATSSGPNTDDDVDERTRLAYLTPPSPSSLLRNPNTSHNHAHGYLRPHRDRSMSQISTSSVAPSLAQTVLSLFQFELEDEGCGVYLPDEGFSEHHLTSLEDEHGDHGSLGSIRHEFRIFSTESWKRYFRPMRMPLYYRALIHLLILNFPFALAAWLYLFVFTLTGTTTLVALPIGALLCFLDLLGARAFARAELSLQTRFHSPLSFPTPYPPRPIFTRYRELTSQEVESGRLPSSSNGMVKERSFYKNAYSMFTDPTSYQALFYFIVIKPPITLGLLLATLVFVIPSMILILPGPAALRAVRKLGKWQANIAVEGLYYAVR